MNENETKLIEAMTKKELLELFQEGADVANTLKEAKQTVEEEKDKTLSDLAKIKEDADSNLEQIQQLKQTASGINLEEIQGIEETAKSKLTEIMAYHSRLFIDKEFTFTNPDGQSIKTEIETMLEGYKVTHEYWETKFERLKEDIEGLKEEISSLLPSATTAGLAGNFREAKNAAGKTTWLWSGFIIAIIGMLLIYLYPIIQGKPIEWEHMTLRLFLGGPFIWLAWYCQHTISTQKKLAEYYNHKENIMALYTGFSKTIKEMEEKDHSSMSDTLTSGAIKEILKNPADGIKNPKFLDYLTSDKSSKST